MFCFVIPTNNLKNLKRTIDSICDYYDSNERYIVVVADGCSFNPIEDERINTVVQNSSNCGILASRIKGMNVGLMNPSVQYFINIDCGDTLTKKLSSSGADITAYSIETSDKSITFTANNPRDKHSFNSVCAKVYKRWLICSLVDFYRGHYSKFLSALPYCNYKEDLVLSYFFNANAKTAMGINSVGYSYYVEQDSSVNKNTKNYEVLFNDELNVLSILTVYPIEYSTRCDYNKRQVLKVINNLNYLYQKTSPTEDRRGVLFDSMENFKGYAMSFLEGRWDESLIPENEKLGEIVADSFSDEEIISMMKGLRYEFECGNSLL